MARNLNMEYSICLMSGKEYRINQEEHDAILGGTGMIYIKRLNVTINASSISVIEPANMSLSSKIDREKQQIGIAPNGDVIEKRYGTWYYQKSNNDYQYDDNGLCLLKYEGEQILPTPTEYEALYKNIDSSEWTGMLIGNSNPDTLRIASDRTSTGSFERIGELTALKESMSSTGIADYCDEHEAFKVDCPHGVFVEGL